MAIEYWPIERLVFYARNPRKNDFGGWTVLSQ